MVQWLLLIALNQRREGESIWSQGRRKRAFLGPAKDSSNTIELHGFNEPCPEKDRELAIARLYTIPQIGRVSRLRTHLYLGFSRCPGGALPA